jgi:hypothetical protein
LSDPIKYNVVETSEVTEDAIEKIVNDWVGRGWRFESMQFAMREASRRPSMAFLFFVRPPQGD